MCVRECEENLRCVQIKGVLRLDLTTDLWLASRQSGTRVKHVGNLRFMTAGALQDKNVQSGQTVSSRLVLVARLSRQNALFGWKLSFHIPYIQYYKYPYTHEILKASRENFERETLEKNKIDSSTIFIIWVFKFLYSHPLHWYILERYILPNPYLTKPISVRRYFGAWEAV